MNKIDKINENMFEYITIYIEVMLNNLTDIEISKMIEDEEINQYLFNAENSFYDYIYNEYNEFFTDNEYLHILRYTCKYFKENYDTDIDYDEYINKQKIIDKYAYVYYYDFNDKIDLFIKKIVNGEQEYLK